jgi:hypothetical protein
LISPQLAGQELSRIQFTKTGERANVYKCPALIKQRVPLLRIPADSMAPPTKVIDLTGSDGPGELATGRTPLQTISNKPIAKKAPAPKKKIAPGRVKGHVLIWLPTHEKGAKGLKVIGVYPSKEKALAAGEVVKSPIRQCGNGHFIVGPKWSDEIELIVKPVDCFLGA